MATSFRRLNRFAQAATVQGLSASHTVTPGNFGLTPGQIQGMDPQGIGVSTSVMIPYLQSFASYQANDNSVGDGVNFVGYRFKGPLAINTNWYITRADYKLTSSGNRTLFWRGAFNWSVYNITNSVRFDAFSVLPEIDVSGGFGKYSSILTRPRVMEFALRYSF
jgi:hypothetical protein